MKKTMVAAAVTGLLFAGNAAADIRFSGFASINAGKVLSGDGVPQFGQPPQFLADYPIVSVYDEDWSFKPETLVGLQAQADLSEGLSVTAQLVSRGADDFDVNFEWAYVSYEIDPNWTIQAGRKRLPLFYYSDFYDVGYAYVWMRPPADTYTWQIFNYNGVNLMYTGELGDWAVSGNIYGGKEESNDNRLLSQFFFRQPVKEMWNDILGGVLTLSKDWFEARFAYMSFENEREVNGEPAALSADGDFTLDGDFMGVALNADWGDIFILTEVNVLDRNAKFETAMISAGYRFDEITPFIGYSIFEQENTTGTPGAVEEHDTLFLGVRWDFHPSAAFKVQYDDVDDKSVSLPVAGDSQSITFGVDVVF